MAANNPYATYKQNSFETKSAGELTLMLYEGCLKFIKRAEKAIDDNQMEEKNTNLIKAQNIVRELMVTLDMKVAVSKDMLPMYDYILNQLIEANMKNDKEALQNAAQFVADFRDTWKEVIKADRQSRHGQKAAPAEPAAAPSEPAAAPSKQDATVNPYAKARMQNPYAANASNPYAKAKQAAAAAAAKG
ncbi:flagellar protein FliS [Alkalicoccus daliensis]|uniref:Flagellar protein FliS n=1 Tax=Alkalicoccus daliensis TaxID=745820 RepID=A0A1H0JNV0_9BACI|nr:flagellar protein FliS [Alkalicoccus daliensis]